MKAILLLLWLLPIAFNVYLDRNGRKPNYLEMFMARGAIAIFHAALFNPQSWADYWPILLFQLTSFWLLFELALNIIRKKPLLYYDTLEHDSGYIDRFFAWAGYKAHAIAKAVATVVCVISILILL